MIGHQGNPLNHGNEPVPAPEESYVKKSLTFGLMGIALIGFVILGWMAVEESKAPKDLAEVPVIKVDPKPFKVEPANTAQGDVPHKDIEVYNAISTNGAPANGGKNAVLSPNPEEPVSRQQLQQQNENASAANASPSLDAALAQQKSGAAAKIVYPGTVETAQAQPVEGSEADIGSHEAIGDPKAPMEAAPSSGKHVVDVASIPRANQADDSDAADDSSDDAEADDVPEKPKAKVAVKKTDKPKLASKSDKSDALDMASISTSSGGGAESYLLQLGAYRSSDAADKGWSMLQKRFPGSLGNLSRSVKKVELGSKGTFYRLYAGPVGSRDNASGVCKQLMSQRQGCILAKP